MLNKEANKDIYSFKNDDKFDRKDFVYNITKNIVFDDDIQNKVIAINSPWGTGKTQLIKMWEDELKNDCFEDTEIKEKKENIKIIHYNAWNNDDWGEALTPLIYDLKNKVKLEDEIVKSINILTKMSLNKISKITSVVALNMLCKKIGLDKETRKYLKNIVKEYKDIITNEDLLIVDDNFSIYNKAKEDLRDYLNKQIKKNEKIIYFIDELDRCRPTFAIQTLEILKHLFYIPNYTFIISVDLDQLSRSIKTLYGQETDTEGYLHKFFDYRFQIPSPSIDNYIKFLINKNNIKIKNINMFIKDLIQIIETVKMNLRDIILFFNSLKVLTKFHFNNEINNNNYKKYIIYCILLAIKYKSSIEYNEIIKNGQLYISKEIQVNKINKNMLYSFKINLNCSYILYFNHYLNDLFFLIEFDKSNSQFFYYHHGKNYFQNNILGAVKGDKNKIPDTIYNLFELSKLTTYNVDTTKIGQYFERELEMFTTNIIESK